MSIESRQTLEILILDPREERKSLSLLKKKSKKKNDAKNYN